MKTSLLALVLIPLTPCLALEPAFTKIFSTRIDGNTFDDSFGVALAATERWIVAGEPGNDEVATGAGAAYLIDAATGVVKRKLLAPDGNANHAFGSAVAISGDRVVVGAPGRAGQVGGAYVFDAPSGRLLGQLFHELPSTDDRFGAAVAIAGNLVVVGAPGDDTFRGSLFVFDITGIQSDLVSDPDDKLVSSPRASFDFFGEAVATDGRFIAGGAPNAGGDNGAVSWFDAVTRVQMQRVTGTGTERLGTSVLLAAKRLYAGAPAFNSAAGRVRAYDLDTGIVSLTLNSPFFSPGRDFGFHLAANSALLAVGSPEEGASLQGTVHLFDLNGGQTVPLRAPDGKGDDKFGSRIALAGDTLIASADPGGNALLYRVHPVSAPFPNNRFLVAKLGDSAPGTGAGRFQRFQSLVLGEDDNEEVLLQATTSNAVSGLWEFENTPLNPAVLSTTNLSPLPGSDLFARAFGTPLWNNSTMALLPATLRGSNASALIRFDPTPTPVFSVLLRTGSVVNTVVSGNRTLAKLDQTVQSSNDTSGLFGLATRFKTGVDGVNASNDSGVLMLEQNGALLASALEGSTPSAGLTLGQVSPRTATSETNLLYHARTLSPTQPQALFFFNSTFQLPLVIAGNTLSIEPGTVSSILGETTSPDGFAIARVSLRGTGITSQNDDVLVRFPAAVVIALGEGQTATDLPPGVVISRILRFWALNNTRLAAQVLLRGPGVNASNDGALILLNENNERVCLFREGDLAPGCDGARLGVLQGIEIDPKTGDYAVLASLTGTTAARNQALFGGELDQPLVQFRLRKPWLQLRKGQLYRGALGTTSTLKSIALGARDGDATGASGKGLSGAVRGGEVSLLLTFSDRSVQAVTWGLY